MFDQVILVTIIKWHYYSATPRHSWKWSFLLSRVILCIYSICVSLYSRSAGTLWVEVVSVTWSTQPMYCFILLDTFKHLGPWIICALNTISVISVCGNSHKTLWFREWCISSVHWISVHQTWGGTTRPLSHHFWEQSNLWNYMSLFVSSLFDLFALCTTSAFYN